MATWTVSSQVSATSRATHAALGREVELFRVPAAELVRPYAEPVVAGLLGYRHQIGAGREGGEQFVHGGARQLKSAGHIGR